MKNDENSLQKAQAEFISTVSHELRTPLTSIRGFADTLLTSGDKLSEEQKQKLETLYKDQIREFELSIRNYKNKIMSIRKRLAEGN